MDAVHGPFDWSNTDETFMSHPSPSATLASADVTDIITPDSEFISPHDIHVLPDENAVDLVRFAAIDDRVDHEDSDNTAIMGTAQSPPGNDTEASSSNATCDGHPIHLDDDAGLSGNANAWSGGEVGLDSVMNVHELDFFPSQDAEVAANQMNWSMDAASFGSNSGIALDPLGMPLYAHSKASDEPSRTRHDPNLVRPGRKDAKGLRWSPKRSKRFSVRQQRRKAYRAVKAELRFGDDDLMRIETFRWDLKTNEWVDRGGMRLQDLDEYVKGCLTHSRIRPLRSAILERHYRYVSVWVRGGGMKGAVWLRFNDQGCWEGKHGSGRIRAKLGGLKQMLRGNLAPVEVSSR